MSHKTTTTLPNSERRWTKDAKEFIIHITPNIVRMTRYRYTQKPILKIVNNPKCLKFVIKDGHVKVKGSN